MVGLLFNWEESKGSVLNAHFWILVSGFRVFRRLLNWVLVFTYGSFESLLLYIVSLELIN